MKYTVEVGSGAVMYIPSFARSEVYEGESHRHRQHCDLISLLLFFQYKESRLKMYAL
jgi:hypothetical protein